jgi:hypothetical protein
MLIVFLEKHKNSKRYFYTFLIDPFQDTNPKSIRKKVEARAGLAVFVNAILLLFATKIDLL